MNREIERAYIVHDINAIRSGLARAGFTLAKKESQVNLYFDHRFLKLIENKRYMRVRWIDGWANAEISFSNPAIVRKAEIRPQHAFQKKTRRSTEGIISTLNSLGFYEALVMEKERELFTIGGGMPPTGVVHVELDAGITIHPRDVDDLPRAKHHDVRIEDTVQVCIEVDGDDSSGAEAEIERVAREIGFQPKDMVTENYFDRYFNKPELH
jgi:adenylate cyclase class IV